MRVAVVGAGISGLACAHGLKASGAQLVVFDKGRRPGGRLSSKVGPDLAWDYGAPYFTVRRADFARQVSVWEAEGTVCRWPSAGATAWIGYPAMSAPIASMARDLDVRFGTLVMRLALERGAWRVVHTGAEDELFDAVVVAIPAEQAAALLCVNDLAMARPATLIASQPCWTGMFSFDHRLASPEDMVRRTDVPVLAIRNSAKPGRPPTECWVVQGGARWSTERLDLEPSRASAELLGLFSAAVGSPLPEPTAKHAHRWRYAFNFGLSGAPLWNGDLRLGACGDWVRGLGVESAWIAGRDLARAIQASLLETVQ